MSALFENAVDSLRIGMKFFLDDEEVSHHKHAILTIFHSIELFLKEYLSRANPILIYKNIDKKIADDSLTVGIQEILARLDNLGLPIPDEEKNVIEKIQRRRNRIEHHRYDRSADDGVILGEALKFITFFVEEILEEKLSEHLDSEILQQVKSIVFKYAELQSLAHFRLEKWLKESFPDWDPLQHDMPDEFIGTLQCPECRQEFLVISGLEKPFCFFCNEPVDAVECSECGEVHRSDEPCSCDIYGEYRT
jgi:hypothetical protein